MTRKRRHQVALDTPPMDVQLTDVAFGGEALGHLPDGRVVFVPRSLPGETARVRLQEDRRDYARAELEALLSSAPGRVEAPCPYYHAGCGGCSWQHADYPLQLRVKHAVVVDQLRRIGHFAEPESFVRPTLGMLNPWHYRNQARFTVGRKFGELCFTFRSSHRLLRIDHCWIVHPAINEALAQLQSKLSVVPGRVHQVSIRVGANTGQALVAPALPGIGQIETGQPWLEEELLGARFRLRPTSFFQVNTLRERSDLGDSSLAAGDQFEARTGHRALLPVPPDGLSMAEILALLVLDRLRPSASDVIVDAYSGVGTFAVLLAPLVKHVIAIEEARAAVQDARHNARHLSNVTLIEAKTEAALPALDSVVPALAARPTAVILDPARVGAHPAVLDALLAQRPERLVYVSCDPTTLARDLRVLVDGGYTLTDVLPIDMFPQTYHIESVATLIR